MCGFFPSLPVTYHSTLLNDATHNNSTRTLQHYDYYDYYYDYYHYDDHYDYDYYNDYYYDYYDSYYVMDYSSKFSHNIFSFLTFFLITIFWHLH